MFPGSHRPFRGEGRDGWLSGATEQLRVVAVIVIVGGALCATTATAKSPSWSIQTTPNPTGATSSSLWGVSCPSTNDCTAVGSFTTSEGKTMPLVEHWNGASWAIQTTPAPNGGVRNSLAAVSCPSKKTCVAVGSYTTGTSSREMPLVERWNGRNWTIQSAPTPDLGGGRLSAVSCPSADRCTAVGGVGATLAETWDGKAWSIQPTPFIGPVTSALLGVSCTFANACFASGIVYHGLIGERWDGHTWQLIPFVSAQSQFDSLPGLSCASTTDCAAVGSTGLPFTVPLAAHWDGVRWSTQFIPGPSGGGNLLGVSCPTANRCTAVGAAGLTTLVEQWNDKLWKIQDTPNPNGGGLLRSVWCTSPSKCTAVGSAGNATLAERYS